jgi:hypothetical protein
MTEDLMPESRLPMRYTAARRAVGRVQLSSAIALIVVSALVVITVSIGMAEAETLGAMVDDETGRLALFSMVAAVSSAGGIIGAMMWFTAPKPARRCNIYRL